MSLTFPETSTAHFAKDSWVRFEGTAEYHGEFAWLTPSVDESLTLKLAGSDVREVGENVVVRVGASILKVAAIKSNDPTTVPQTSSGSAELECDNNPTACIGAVELCCHSGKIIGSCVGYWRCP